MPPVQETEPDIVGPNQTSLVPPLEVVQIVVALVLLEPIHQHSLPSTYLDRLEVLEKLHTQHLIDSQMDQTQTEMNQIEWLLQLGETLPHQQQFVPPQVVLGQRYLPHHGQYSLPLRRQLNQPQQLLSFPMSWQFSFNLWQRGYKPHFFISWRNNLFLYLGKVFLSLMFGQMNCHPNGIFFCINRPL